MSTILVFNIGSSSVKFDVFDTKIEKIVFKGSLERVLSISLALKEVSKQLEEENHLSFDAIAHRVAHGGKHFKQACFIDESVVSAIKDCSNLAPLHNPPALEGILSAKEHWPSAQQVAVFDTAFHQSIPAYAYTYAVPQKWRDLGVRRYGFHGTSHVYVFEKACHELNLPLDNNRIISCHLGNGASICAIKNGKSIDTSMGMTALEGLVMGTRSGDVDPGMFYYLETNLGMSISQIQNDLYHESGLKALSGCGNDMRDIQAHALKGNKQAQLALEVYAYRVKKYIGSYAASLNGIDALIFTGGVGENSSYMRSMICQGLEFMGLEIDDSKNQKVTLKEDNIEMVQTSSSPVKILVIKTKEDWMIAKEAKKLLEGARVCP